MPSFTRILAVGALALAPIAALAQTFTAKTVHLRAGPDRGYPVVVVLGPNVPVEVHGCLDGYTWCDVSYGPDQGWVYAANLVTPYEQRRVPLLGYGAIIGLPLVIFSFDRYWDDHYRGRPWYRERSRWEHHSYYRPPGRPYPGRPEYRPPGRPDFHPGRPDFHSGRPDGRPDGRPGNRPDGRPDGRPGGRPEGRPDARPPGRPPEGRPQGGERPSGGRPAGRPSNEGHASPGRPSGGGSPGRPHNDGRQ